MLAMKDDRQRRPSPSEEVGRTGGRTDGYISSIRIGRTLLAGGGGSAARAGTQPVVARSAPTRVPPSVDEGTGCWSTFSAHCILARPQNLIGHTGLAGREGGSGAGHPDPRPSMRDGGGASSGGSDTIIIKRASPSATR